MPKEDNFTVKDLGQVPCDLLEEIALHIRGEPREQWARYAFRQKAGPVHSKTESIPCMWLPNATRFSNTQEAQDAAKVYLFKEFDAYMEPLQRMCAWLQSKYDEPCTATKMVFINLPAGHSIPSHIDMGDAIRLPHRIHIPIQTDPDVSFTVDHIAFHLEYGRAYELNNLRVHSVENNGANPRYHLMIDLLPDRYIPRGVKLVPIHSNTEPFEL